MKRFSFRLEKVLKWKKHEEDLIRLKLAGIRNEMGKLKLWQDQYRHQEWEAMSLLGTFSLPPFFLSIVHQNLLFFQEKRKKCLQALQKKKEEEEACLQKLRECWQQKRVLERLKEKKWEEHLEALELEEKKFLDDIKNRSYA